jgi:hypothetical protein
MGVRLREDDLRSQPRSLFMVLGDFLVFARCVHRLLNDFLPRHHYGILFDLDSSFFFK